MALEFARDQRRPGEIPMSSSDRASLPNWSLLDLIAAAYSVRATQVSGPAWLSDQFFDVEAKVSDGTPKEELNAMLQSLLEERFGLKVHRAPQTVQGFALIVGKNGPKLKLAGPPPTPAQGPPEVLPEHPGEHEAGKAAGDVKNQQKTPEHGESEEGSFHSITTEELAFQLVHFTNAPVVDETGLAGKYSVSIETSTNRDGTGVTVFDAVEKLGLKLEPRKVTVETVVVDQVSKTPTAN
jgi:uncharacterized protein (TIGR03435 family)